MKIYCDRDKLNDAIQVVSKAVARKSNLASIEGILLVTILNWALKQPLIAE